MFPISQDRDENYCKSFSWITVILVLICVSVRFKYVIGTESFHKNGNIQNPCPCGDISLVPMRKQAYKSCRIKFQFYSTEITMSMRDILKKHVNPTCVFVCEQAYYL